MIRYPRAAPYGRRYPALPKEQQVTETICGTGQPCERTCPVMRLGRVCPDLPTFLEEVRAVLAADPMPATSQRPAIPELAPQLV